MCAAQRQPFRVLGLSGGLDPVRPIANPVTETRMVPGPQMGPPTWYHDSAAALLVDGRIVAGVEEERLNRLKHSNRIPAGAIRHCLATAGLRARDLDCVAYYASETTLDSLFAIEALRNQRLPPLFTARGVLQHALARYSDLEVDAERFLFVEHHYAHALSAAAHAPFGDALVVTLDGIGEALSGTVWTSGGLRLERLADIAGDNSLGKLYQVVVSMLGYGWFDEYKVMGLAPYGDPRRYRASLAKVVELGPEGTFAVHLERLPAVAAVLGAPRRAGQEFLQTHKDLAAALQEIVERTALHALRHYRTRTGLSNICLAGGVAHNSSMTGAILRSGLFTRVFVHPASHDAGCALGAAIAAHRKHAADVPVEPLTHVYWGPDVGSPETIASRLDDWRPLIDVAKPSDVFATTAQLLADGAVVGWVQGRSEFGPRALGNRSILADPRPASNKDRINAMVKKREGYRPFAPSAMAEYAAEFFEIPAGNVPAFMTYTVLVREGAREVLGAVTHVDRTARLQTVSRDANRPFWSLLDAFRRLTGIPVLLNTSFNNNAEPIVDSIDDAVACFLTTGLTHLVVGDLIVTKRDVMSHALLDMVPTIPAHIRIVHARQHDSRGQIVDVFKVETTDNVWTERLLTPATHAILVHADGSRTLREIVRLHGGADDPELLAALEELWARRLIRIQPPARSAESMSLQDSEPAAVRGQMRA